MDFSPGLLSTRTSIIAYDQNDDEKTVEVLENIFSLNTELQQQFVSVILFTYFKLQPVVENFMWNLNNVKPQYNLLTKYIKSIYFIFARCYFHIIRQTTVTRYMQACYTYFIDYIWD